MILLYVILIVMAILLFLSGNFGEFISILVTMVILYFLNDIAESLRSIIELIRLDHQ